MKTPLPNRHHLQFNLLLAEAAPAEIPADKNEELVLALAECQEHRRAYAAATSDVDAVLTPTTQTPAIPIDQIDQHAGRLLLPCAGPCGRADEFRIKPRGDQEIAESRKISDRTA